MSHSEFDELARQPKESVEALDVRLVEFRSCGASIIECIKYVVLNQGCSLAEAKDIVVNSRAWSDRKEEFLRHQWDMFEEFLDVNKDRIEEIQQTITPDGTKWVVRMKTTG
jgi:hypothetical protein